MTLLIIFVGLELSFRAYDIFSGRILSDDLLAHLYMLSGDGHPFLEYTSNKNFHGFLSHIEPGKKFEVHTKSDGFRTHEFYSKLPGKFRILILGDSFMYGYNANQDQTTPAVLERLLQEQISENIEVLSLGVPSYSTIKYALLTRSYIDYLNPDMIIVAVDQNDFKGDLSRMDKYIFDDDGSPLVLKDAVTIQETTGKVQIIMNETKGLNIVSNSPGRLLRLRFGSSLFNNGYVFWKFLNTKANQWKTVRKVQKQKDSSQVIQYGDLVEKYGTDTSEVFLNYAAIIPYELETAKEKYKLTFQALQYIKKKSDENNVILYFSSYPYPWEVSIKESLHYQLFSFGTIYDFRDHKVYSQLMDDFSSELEVKHLNSYPVFEVETEEKKYGKYDPHFSVYGYNLYANFLADSIREDILKKLRTDY